ncbi:MAG TPA: LytTR family DNA-binding domain-containing protein, partial [Acidimicrobiales bacterium]|nr:LytTR family DNA-binding domain-containing protein [Acidimicrobiales bacterium]
DELSYLLDRSPLVERVAVARSAPDALRLLQRAEFDAVLLDIRMPGLDGMELARVLTRFTSPPVVIFVTAHEGHALEAFDVGAAGYLLKPVDEARLDRLLRRAVLPARHGGAGETDPQHLGGTENGPAGVVAVEAGNRTLLVARTDIGWVESAGDYVRIHLRDGSSHLLRVPMAALEEHWAEHGFVRVHRSYLVSLRDISELRSDGARTEVRVLGATLPVSRRHVRELRDRLVRHVGLHGR